MKEKLNVWLDATVHVSKDGKYRHQRLRENLDKRSEILEDLKGCILKAHEDAWKFFKGSTRVSLDPFEEEEAEGENDFSSSIAADYLSLLPMQTLQGYLGEVFAGIIAENFSPFGDGNWKVPAYLFRFHNAAFEYLEVLRQTGRKKQSVLGRTGDDCLAFTLKEGEIEKILYCEAKCSRTHNPSKVKEGHEKFGESAIVDIYQLIQILRNYSSQEEKKWFVALERFLLLEKRIPYLREFCRHNFMIYVHGTLPAQKLSWLSEEKPHKAYIAKHPLEAVELHLHNIEDLIGIIYNIKKEPSIPASA